MKALYDRSDAVSVEKRPDTMRAGVAGAPVSLSNRRQFR